MAVDWRRLAASVSRRMAGGRQGTSVGVRRRIYRFMPGLLCVLLAESSARREFPDTSHDLLGHVHAARPVAQVCGDLLSIAAGTTDSRLSDDPRHTLTSMYDSGLDRQQHRGAATGQAGSQAEPCQGCSSHCRQELRHGGPFSWTKVQCLTPALYGILSASRVCSGRRSSFPHRRLRPGAPPSQVQ
jgi:hypothetical protein